jgi:hypothetical protein
MGNKLDYYILLFKNIFSFFSRPLNKREKFILLYNKHKIVSIHFLTNDSTIPEPLKKNKTCVLQFGRGLVKPIEDLMVTDEEISGTLSFRMTLKIPQFYCVIPWKNVISVYPENPNPPTLGTPKNELVLKAA